MYGLSICDVELLFLWIGDRPERGAQVHLYAEVGQGCGGISSQTGGQGRRTPNAANQVNK